MDCLANGDTDFFDSVTGVLLGDTLVPYLNKHCLDCVLQTSIGLIKEKWFRIEKRQKSRRYPTETLIDADYSGVVFGFFVPAIFIYIYLEWIFFLGWPAK